MQFRRMWTLGSVQEIAAWMILRFGADALAEAKARAERCEQLGDRPAAADWYAVAGQIQEALARRAKNGGSNGSGPH